MEFKISDLLDDLREVDVDIQPHTQASEKRIRELTMKKIHAEQNRRRQGLSTLSKVLIAAAILTALALPVAAATSFHFTDWLNGQLAGGGGYDNSLFLGSAGKNWEVSGYVLDVRAEAASAQGLTLTCQEWGSGEKAGTLTADDSFRLERWNGSDYTAMTPQSEPAAGQGKTLVPGSTVTWQVTWGDSYGPLASGSYRIGKTFTYSDPAGKTQNVDIYAKFRVFAEEMAPYVESYKAALEDLHSRDSYHLTNTIYAEGGECKTDAGVYQYYTKTVWKNGSDYLQELQYVSRDGTVIAHRGCLLRDGKGFELTWNGDNVLSGVASWEAVEYLNEASCERWDFGLEIFDASVGEVFVEGNSVSILEGHTYEWADEARWYKKTYTKNEQGQLIAVQYAHIPSPEELDQEEFRSTLEVYDTSADEIAKTIAAQNVSKPLSLSWAEEQAKYPAGAEGVKTGGFVNTTPQTVNAGNAAAIAQKECTLEWQNTAVVFFDETAKVWKVDLGHSQDDTICQTVYLSGEGVTLLVVTK